MPGQHEIPARHYPVTIVSYDFGQCGTLIEHFRFVISEYVPEKCTFRTLYFEHKCPLSHMTK